ncbi:MAG: enamine deaminase RidA (YjgF/YER057c/UK114 family) [Chlamydiales bacterium]|jgi:enamine deaminase RidA (YjgF/YER057c/UK114 family)
MVLAEIAAGVGSDDIKAVLEGALGFVAVWEFGKTALHTLQQSKGLTNAKRDIEKCLEHVDKDLKEIVADMEMIAEQRIVIRQL